MANLLQNPTHQAKIGYNGFDLSFLSKFTSSTGELLPVFYDILSPGDKVTCNTTIRTRTQPLASAAYCEINEHVDWFFVPMNQIYSPFKSMFYGVADSPTSLILNGDFDMRVLPVIDTAVVNQYIEEFAESPRVDMFGYHNELKLFDFLGTGLLYSILDSNATTLPLPMFFAAAYQKIYSDYFRIDDRESPLLSVYQLDRHYRGGTITTQSLFDLYSMRYRPRKRDFFTNVFVSPLFNGGPSGIGQNISDDVANMFQQWLVPTGFRTANVAEITSGSVSQVGSDTVVNPSFIYPSSDPEGLIHGLSDEAPARYNISPTSIRTSFATQKLLEITRRARKTYDAQTLAHFGVRVPRGIDGDVFYLGSQHSTLTIGEVIATSAGSTPAGNTSVLGQVGGKGYGSSRGSDVKFTSPCHGILMAIYSCEPTFDYDASRVVDRLNSYSDMANWYRTEYDNLGMQPVFAYQTNFRPDESVSNYAFYNWQYRWSELKKKFNQTHGGLCINASLNYWSVKAPNSDYSQLSSFHVSPASLNQIMLVQKQPVSRDALISNPYLIYEADPLINEIYFDVKKASKMSTYGLESL